MRNQSTITGSLGVLIAVVHFGFFGSSALAQDGAPTTPMADPSIDGQIGGSPGGPPMGGDQFVIGVGGMYQPSYLGSDDYRFQPLPMVDIKYNRFFVNFQDGIGLNLIDNEDFTIGAGVTMADNYRASDAPDGIGKLSFGVGARGFVKVRQAGFEATLGGMQIFQGSTGGFVADATISRPIFINQSFMLMPSVGVRWADAKHNDRYFGVTADQSTASGLPEFSTGSGFLDAKAELGSMYMVTDRISMGVNAGVTTLLGDVRHSPIVERRTSPYALAFVGYRF